MAECLEKKYFPGAVIIVGRKDKVVFRQAYGHAQWIPEPKPMKIDLIFDLASLTKPIATATSIMILVEQGKISLYDKVRDYIPEFSVYGDEKSEKSEDARLWHLLTHTSGLPAYAEVKEITKLYGSSCSSENLVKYIASLKKEFPPGKDFRYSCLGYIVLAYIIKKVSGEDVAIFAQKNIFKPLGMKHTFFNPPLELRSRCVPTEVIEGKPLIGVVHDPLARLQGGISGNAGLFSTGDDLALFARMMLNGGELNGHRIISHLSLRRMTEIFPDVLFSGRGLGWDVNSIYSTNRGDLFGRSSYGHTGYTGTSIWIDPETKTFLIFLTNRVHPDDKGVIVPIRSRVANLVAAAIIKL
ncbi:MAG: beta-lactamase family protein [Candidatus Aminicenantes bacterium]|nr:beta-lactamase family protein [Candidatus Aminicenantes bacterium]